MQHPFRCPDPSPQGHRGVGPSLDVGGLRKPQCQAGTARGGRQLGGDEGRNYVKEETFKTEKYKVTEGTCEAHFGHCVAAACVARHVCIFVRQVRAGT